MNGNSRLKHKGLADQIALFLSDGKSRTIAEVCDALKRKHGVQSVLETDRRFRLVAPSRVPGDRAYALVHMPSAKPREAGQRPNYTEAWVENPLVLLTRGEPLAVDVANLLGRRCGGMLHEGGKCPKPAPLWPLLNLLAQAKASHSHVVFFADASTRHHVQEKMAFEGMVEAGAVMEVPASYTADSKLLSWADQNNGAVLTDDYKMRGQYAEAYPWTADATRFIGHMVDDEARKAISYVRKKPAPERPRTY